MKDFESGLALGLALSAFCVGILFLRFAIAASSSARKGALRQEGIEPSADRIQRADESRERTSPLARYVVAGVAFGIGGALLAHLVTPALAYAILCLALAGRSVADQVAEERAPRRRSALIGRPRHVDPILLTWIALTAVSCLVLVPWLLDTAYRFAAIVGAACAFMMLWLAWRIASAPPLLFGSDLEAEQVVDRETRAIRTGNICFLTLCAVTVFTLFAGGPTGFVSHGVDYRGFNVLAAVLVVLCAGLWTWKSIYARRLTGTLLPA